MNRSPSIIVVAIICFSLMTLGLDTLFTLAGFPIPFWFAFLVLFALFFLFARFIDV